MFEIFVACAFECEWFGFQKAFEASARPTFVLIALLDFLIDRNHEVFRGKGSAQDLRAKVRSAVQREYPETEADKPENERLGHRAAASVLGHRAFVQETSAARAAQARMLSLGFETRTALLVFG